MQIPVSIRGPFLTLFSLCLWAPFFYVIAATFFPNPKMKSRVTIGIVAFTLLSLIWGIFSPSPYITWFGQLADHSKVVFSWWPGVTRFLPHIPNEVLFFFILGVLGTLTIRYLFEGERWFYWAWALILVQTFFHLSLHSPYTYLPHFEQPESANYWYHSYLFPPSSGAVNEDCFWFWQSEALYLGSQGTHSVFWNRTLPFFLSSRLSTFIHPLYSWLIVSTLFWLISVRAVYLIGETYFSQRVARFAAFLQVSSPAMILYVGQAKPYAVSFSLIAILVALFFRFRSSLTFGICFAVTLLSYELQPWFLIFPLWARVLKVKWLDIAIFSGVAAGIYVCFLQVPHILSRVEVKNTFQPGYGSPLGNAMDLLLSFDVGRLWATLHYSLKSWWVLTSHAFPTLLPFSILGGYWLWKQERHARSLLLLVLPGVLACLLIGVTNQTLYFHYGRMVYGNYVAMMVLAALALDWLGKKWVAVPFALVGLNTIYWNLDVWGFPFIYKYWFYRF